MGAILTQNVTWRNAKIAVDRLKARDLLKPESILTAPQRTIAAQIKTSRFYNQKAKKLKAFCRYLIDNYNGSLDKMFGSELEVLRKELLAISGIGRETADCILLYSGKKLSFVIDAYTKRWMERYGIINNMSNYDQLRSFFMNNLPKDVYIYNEFHALIVHHCHFLCKAKPDCRKCPIKRVNNKIHCFSADKYEIQRT